MAAVIYALCTLTALGCSVLLLRGYRSSRARLLLWSGLCFAGLALNNALVIVDELAIPLADLSPWRIGIGVASMSVLLYGLIFETR
jgi:hypothetical protein